VVSDVWQGLEVRHIAALRAIAEEGTFAGAATRLGYTQSAISQQVAALERITGEVLLERVKGRRPLGLTAAGKLVLRHGEAILARVQAAQADLQALAAGAAGPLRIGTYPSVGVRLLPELLPQFGAEWPQLEVQLRESNADPELLGWVEHGELDLTFCMLPVEEGPFETLELLRDPWLLVLSSLTSANGGSRRGQLLPVQPLLSYRTCPNLSEIESLLRHWGVEPVVVFRSDDNATLQSLVAAGLGVAFMPFLTIDADDPRTVLVDVREQLPPRRVGIAWHRDRHRSAASHAFVDTAARVAATLEAEISDCPFASPAPTGTTPASDRRRRRGDRSRPRRPRTSGVE
jgi:DNA-binding transcriptional LysR family regulator